MNNNPLLLLGMALKAGKLAVGEDPASSMLQHGRATLCILAADAADNTRRRFTNRAETAGCDMITLNYTKSQFGNALGRAECAVAVLTDKGFKSALLKKLGE